MATLCKVGDYLAFGTEHGTVYEVIEIWKNSSISNQGIPRVIESIGWFRDGEYNPAKNDSVFKERHFSSDRQQWDSMSWQVVTDYINSPETIHPNYKVIRKIKQMNTRRQELGYAF